MKERPISHVFGERIRHLRTEKGLSQEQLAELADLHRTFIGRIERGETNVTLENIKKTVQRPEGPHFQIIRGT